MQQFVIPFVAYVLVPIISSLLKLNPTLAQLLKVIIVAGLIFHYRKHYKLIFMLDGWSAISGLVIFVIWVGLEGFYPFVLGVPQAPPTDKSYVLLRLISSILIAPVIEEFFTRYFLNRIIQSKNWEKVPLNKFTLTSFTITVLFFGLSHNRWLPGIITGLILNLVLMKTKRIETCVLAHAIANLALAIYVITTQNWILWG